jgi:hypothetical protein
VEKHRANVMRKLGAKRTADLTAFAIRQGLISEVVKKPLLEESRVL